jgi:hypothetical protein
MTPPVSTSGRPLAQRLHEPCASQPHLRGTGRGPATSTRPAGQVRWKATKHKKLGEAEQQVRRTATKHKFGEAELS